jgi:hypothetical protein
MIHHYMFPFIVLGVTLSTMHHSSLGSLFMASPTRLHPLWYTLWIPVEFLISAMGAGLATIVLLVIVFYKIYRHPIEMKVLGATAKVSVFFLVLYAILKATDLTYHHKWNYVIGPDYTWESTLFLFEVLFQIFIPVIIFSIPKFRKSAFLLALGGASAFLGLGMHRISTGIIGYFRSAEQIYLPSISEVVLSFGIMAGTALIFMFLLERFYIFDEPEEEDDEYHTAKVDYWSSEEAKKIFLGSRLRRVLLTVVIIIPLTAFSLRDQATGSFKPNTRLVERSPVALDTMRTWLRIDANRNGDAVYFPHEYHMAQLEKLNHQEHDQTCAECHHLNAPEDHNSSCRVCHRDMELPTEIFKWENHKDRFENDDKKAEFLALNLDLPVENFKACNSCHEKNMDGLQDYKVKGFHTKAPGFKDAMHGLCLTCHRKIEDDPADPESQGNCRYCHKLNPIDIDATIKDVASKESKLLEELNTPVQEETMEPVKTAE